MRGRMEEGATDVVAHVLWMGERMQKEMEMWGVRFRLLISWWVIQSPRVGFKGLVTDNYGGVDSRPFCLLVCIYQVGLRMPRKKIEFIGDLNHRVVVVEIYKRSGF